MSDIEDQVIALLAETRGEPVSTIRRESRLLEDLGMDGDDAVEFFQAFESRFSPDLSLLYAHWQRHFGPEGFGWPDIRLNWLMLAGGAALVAGMSGFAQPWSILIGAAILAATSLVGLWMRLTALPHMPVTVGDLVAAASAKHWLLSYSARSTPS